jgi:RND superfamily putative drug exporter
MDYEVFLLSRIKERYHATGDNRVAVAEGLAASAKTISSAAIIMVAVFSIFATMQLIMMKQLGIGLALAVLIDATVIRGVLLPAAMKLLGDWNWYMPHWLERLPTLTPEAREPTPRGLAHGH